MISLLVRTLPTEQPRYVGSVLHQGGGRSLFKFVLVIEAPIELRNSSFFSFSFLIISIQELLGNDVTFIMATDAINPVHDHRVSHCNAIINGKKYRASVPSI